MPDADDALRDDCASQFRAPGERVVVDARDRAAAKGFRNLYDAFCRRGNRRREAVARPADLGLASRHRIHPLHACPVRPRVGEERQGGSGGSETSDIAHPAAQRRATLRRLRRDAPSEKPGKRISGECFCGFHGLLLSFLRVRLAFTRHIIPFFQAHVNASATCCRVRFSIFIKTVPGDISFFATSKTGHHISRRQNITISV